VEGEVIVAACVSSVLSLLPGRSQLTQESKEGVDVPAHNRRFLLSIKQLLCSVMQFLV
jgi:hypothetical protein